MEEGKKGGRKKGGRKEGGYWGGGEGLLLSGVEASRFKCPKAGNEDTFHVFSAACRGGAAPNCCNAEMLHRMVGTVEVGAYRVAVFQAN